MYNALHVKALYLAERTSVIMQNFFNEVKERMWEAAARQALLVLLLCCSLRGEESDAGEDLCTVQD